MWVLFRRGSLFLNDNATSKTNIKWQNLLKCTIIFSQAYLEPSRKSLVELFFAKIVNSFQSLTIFAEKAPLQVYDLLPNKPLTLPLFLNGEPFHVSLNGHYEAWMSNREVA